MKQFQVFKIAKLEFKITVHYSLWANVPSCDPLNLLIATRAITLKKKVICINILKGIGNLYQDDIREKVICIKILIGER